MRLTLVVSSLVGQFQKGPEERAACASGPSRVWVEGRSRTGVGAHPSSSFLAPFPLVSSSFPVSPPPPPSPLPPALQYPHPQNSSRTFQSLRGGTYAGGPIKMADGSTPSPARQSGPGQPESHRVTDQWEAGTGCRALECLSLAPFMG